MVKNKIILKIFLFIFFPSILFAEDNIKIEVITDKTDIAVDEVFQIDVKIHGISEDISLNNIDNINENVMIKYIGEMRGYGYNTVDNKRYDYFNLTFIAKILKPGEYEIGPFIINIKDKQYKSDLLKINVSNNDEYSVSNQQYSENKNPDSQNSSKENFYIIELSVDKKEVYINEPINIEVNFYNRLGFQSPNYKSLTFPKTAWIERIDTNKENDNKVQKYNHTYVMHNIEKERIYISNPGIYDIDPATLEFVGLTSPSFLSVPEHIILKTDPIKIKVNSLPTPEPPGFNGAIGTFNLKVDLNPIKLKVKESATLTVSLEGDGNFQNINKIGYSIDDSFDIYSSNNIIEKKDEKNKIKTWEVLIIPSKPGKFDIMLNDFSYFDIKQNKYITIKGEKIILNVLEDEENKKNINGSNNSFTNLNQDNDKTNSNNNANLSNNIHYIKISPGKSNSVSKYKLWFKFVIMFYLAMFIIIIFFIFNKYIFFNILNNNKLSDKNAYKDFLTHINVFKKNVKKIIPQNEINTISNIIEKYFITKFHIDSIEFTPKSISNKLNNHLKSSKINELKNIITKLNFIRFGGEKISNDDFLNIINLIKNYISEIETSKK